MSFGDPQFERLLAERLERRIQDEYKKLGNGIAKDSAYEYGRLCGRISGMKDALADIEATHKTMAASEKSIAADMARR